MNGKGRGFLADPIGHKRTSFGMFSARHGLGADPLPKSATVSNLLPDVEDQGQTSGCTGHAASAAIYVACGPDLGWVPSPCGIYTLGRCMDRPSPRERLSDSGAQPNQVERAAGLFGVRPMRGPTPDGRNSDCDPDTINDEPSFIDLEQDSRALIVGTYSIDSFGDQRLEDIARAIVARRAVTVAIDADSIDFQEYKSGVLEPLGTSLDHYVTLHSFDTYSGGMVFAGRNSWGTSWGNSGDFELSADAVGQLGALIVWDAKVANGGIAR